MCESRSCHGLEDGVNSLVELNSANKDLSVLICDAIAIIQATQTSDVKTFDDFGKTYFQNLVLEFEAATTVVDVFDRCFFYVFDDCGQCFCC